MEQGTANHMRKHWSSIQHHYSLNQPDSPNLAENIGQIQSADLDLFLNMLRRHEVGASTEDAPSKIDVLIGRSFR